MKDVGILVTVSPEIDAWLAQEAALLGLEKVTFVRSLIYQRANGVGALAPAIDEFDDMQPQPTSSVDIEAIVEQRLADAAAQGLTQARAVEAEPEGETQFHYRTTGVLPMRRGPPPRFGNSSQPITRERA